MVRTEPWMFGQLIKKAEGTGVDRQKLEVANMNTDSPELKYLPTGFRKVGSFAVASGESPIKIPSIGLEKGSVPSTEIENHPGKFPATVAYQRGLRSPF